MVNRLERVFAVLVRRLLTASPAARRPFRRRTVAAVVGLEPRLLLSAEVVASAWDVSSVWDIPGAPVVGPAVPQLGVLAIPDVQPSQAWSAASAAAEAAPFPLAKTFKLHSNPGATKRIYLDFDGHTTSDMYWNNGVSFTTPAFDQDGDAAFSNIELQTIQYMWQRVAEDFLPFDVDVTTQNPGIEALRNTGGGDTEWGIRVVIGGDGGWFGGGGGVAYVGSFTWGSDTPCFVFSSVFSSGDRAVAEAISHEAGHSVGLDHDGTASVEYYEGHGSGVTGWAPIMGLSYYREVTQWSSGQYAEASNTEDDLAIITTQNGFGYRSDDHGGTPATATLLASPDGTISARGIVERNDDLDVFRISASAGPVTITVNPAERGPNLDVKAQLLDAQGSVLMTSNPVDQLAASISTTLAAGTYYLRIDGVGSGSANTGYTNYASLGAYTITGTVGAAAPLLFSAETPTGRELFATDGTAAGTILLKDLNGPRSASPGRPVWGNGVAYFAAVHNGQRELWKTDGTPGGTSLIRNLNGALSSNPLDLTWGNGVLYFTAVVGGQRELWRTNGTQTGTVQVKNLRGTQNANVSNLAFADTLYFTATHAGQRELWKSNGTAAGTVTVKNLNGTASSNPSQLTPAGSSLFFTAVVDGQRELWTTDGTIAGTRLVKDLRGSAGSAPSTLTWGDGRLYFTAIHANQRELWKTDGTAAGTTRVANLNGTKGSNPANLAWGDGVLYFAATHLGERELWKTTGTSPGAVRVKDINGGGSGTPQNLTWGDGILYFTAMTGGQRELWRSNGTSGGTVQVRNLNGSQSAQPNQLTWSGGRLFFTARSGSEEELFRSNGTSAGTSLVTNLNGDAGAAPRMLTAAPASASSAVAAPSVTAPSGAAPSVTAPSVTAPSVTAPSATGSATAANVLLPKHLQTSNGSLSGYPSLWSEWLKRLSGAV